MSQATGLRAGSRTQTPAAQSSALPPLARFIQVVPEVQPRQASCAVRLLRAGPGKAAGGARGPRPGHCPAGPSGRAPRRRPPVRGKCSQLPSEYHLELCSRHRVVAWCVP